MALQRDFRELTPEQRMKQVFEALKVLVAGSRGGTSAAPCLSSIGDSPLWSKLAPNALEARIDDLPIKVVAFDDLIRLKELAGRPEDLLDLQRLREAREGS